MSRKRYLLYVAVAALTLVAVAMLASPEPSTGVAAQVDMHMAAVMDDIAARSLSDPNAMMSSNPYDYARGPQFDRLVALGTPALPVIEKRLDAAGESGLREYLFAIAAERIARVDLKGGKAAWQTGKEWPARWRAHLEAVPAEVEKVAASRLSSAEKRQRLQVLGTPAIPAVLDRVAGGDETLSPALTALIAGTAEVPDPPANATPAWARQNRERFGVLRTLVSEAR